MSALPLQAYHPRKVNNFLALPIERTDDVLMTDEEYFQFKGGMEGWVRRFGSSLGLVSLYLILTKRFTEVCRFNITGGTFLKSNVIFLGSYFFFQKFDNHSKGLTDRSYMHNNALLFRVLYNYELIDTLKKKPIFY